MGIYERNGTELNTAFDKFSVELDNAYSADGANVFVKNRIIKVMTYNVGTWYEGKHDNVPSERDADYYALQKGIIQANDADIICIEEYAKQFSKAGRTGISVLQECGYTYIHEQGGDNPQAASAVGRCVASKYPITNYTERNFTDGGGMYYDSCTITVKGIPIFVVVTHLHWNNPTLRASEMATIMALVQDKSTFIIAGDFNTVYSRDTSRQDYINVIQPLINAGYNIANCGDWGFLITCSDYPEDDWTGVIDNIVTSSNIDILDVYVDETKMTDGLNERVDHMPLVATLEL